jgi:hypothetical protein
MSSDLVDIGLASTRVELKAIEEDLDNPIEMGEEIPEKARTFVCSSCRTARTRH